MVYSAYSSFTLPPAASASSGVGSGGGGKQFGITRCLPPRPFRPRWEEPFVTSTLVGTVEDGRESSFGVVAPDVARDEVGVNISRRKKNLAWLTASRCCARRIFSSTCVRRSTSTSGQRLGTPTRRTYLGDGDVKVEVHAHDRSGQEHDKYYEGGVLKVGHLSLHAAELYTPADGRLGRWRFKSQSLPIGGLDVLLVETSTMPCPKKKAS